MERRPPEASKASRSGEPGSVPIYEFDCPACGKRFDELVSTSDERVPCPHCGSQEVVKRFSTFSPGTAAPAAETMPCGAPAAAA